MNDYYEVSLKRHRIDLLKNYSNYKFIKGDICSKIDLEDVFIEYAPHIVVNLAAQTGVRYSIENPETYIQSNIIGFLMSWRFVEVIQ